MVHERLSVLLVALATTATGEFDSRIDAAWVSPETSSIARKDLGEVLGFDGTLPACTTAGFYLPNKDGECTSYAKDNMAAGTNNELYCDPGQVWNAASYKCIKSGIVTFSVLHSNFYDTTDDTHCGNWWAAKCVMEKRVACTVGTVGATTSCTLQKKARCLTVCKGFKTTPGYACKHQGPIIGTDQAFLDQAFTRTGRQCYPDCPTMDAVNAVMGKTSGGKTMQPSDWCLEQLSGY